MSASYINMSKETSTIAPSSSALPTSEMLALDNAFEGESTVSPSGSTTVRIVDGELTYFNALGLESTADHQHVSKIWQDKCQTAAQFHDVLKHAENSKYDLTLSDAEVRLNADLTLQQPIPDMDGRDVANVGFTSHGLYTLTHTAAIPRSTVDYLTSNDPKFADVRPSRLGILANLVNEDLDIRNDQWENPSANMKKMRRGMKENGVPDPRNMVLRLRDNEEGKPVVRAVVSERYTRELSNLQVYEMMLQCFSEADHSRILASHVHHDGDDMIGNLLLPDDFQTFEGDSDYGVGIAFRNSEVKRYIWEIRPFIFRAICLNGCIWGRRDAKYFISKKHLGSCDIQTLNAECRRVVGLALSHGQSFLTQMMMTKEVKIQDAARVLAQVADEQAITRSQMASIAQAYNLSRETEFVGTAFGIVNAITAGAQDFDAGTRNHLESVAGDLVSPSLDADLGAVLKYWEHLDTRSQRLSEKDVTWTRELLAV